jgi:hypothetical protein
LSKKPPEVRKINFDEVQENSLKVSFSEPESDTNKSVEKISQEGDQFNS